MQKLSTTRQSVKSPERFRRAVKVALAQRDWTQATLARHIERSRQAVNRAIRTGAYPGVCARIAKVLDIAL